METNHQAKTSFLKLATRKLQEVHGNVKNFKQWNQSCFPVQETKINLEQADKLVL